MGHYKPNNEKRLRVIYRAVGRLFMEFLPFVCAVLMWVICLQYARHGLPVWAPHNHTGAYIVFGFSVSASWMVYSVVSSRAMGFCTLHRAMLVYAWAGCAGIYFDEWFGFGALRWLLQAVYLVAGFVIIMKVIYKMIWKRIWKK